MSSWQLLSHRNFSPINTCGYNSYTTKNSCVLLCFPNVTSDIIFPSIGIILPIGPNKRFGCGFTGFLTRDAMWRLIKLVLAPVSIIAQQGWSPLSHFTHNPGLRVKFPVATTLGSSVFFASNTTGSFLCRILKDPGSASKVCVSTGGFVQNHWQGVRFRKNATWAKNLVHLVPSAFITVSRSVIPAVAVLWTLRPISVLYMRSISQLTIILGLVLV